MASKVLGSPTVLKQQRTLVYRSLGTSNGSPRSPAILLRNTSCGGVSHRSCAYYSSSSSSAGHRGKAPPSAYAFTLDLIPQEFANSTFFALHRPLLDLRPLTKAQRFTLNMDVPGTSSPSAHLRNLQVSIINQDRNAGSLGRPEATPVDPLTPPQPFQQLKALDSFKADPQVEALAEYMAQVRPFRLPKGTSKMATSAPHTIERVAAPVSSVAPLVEAPEESLIPEAMRLGPFAPRLFSLDPSSPQAMSSTSQLHQPGLAPEDAEEMADNFLETVELRQEACFYTAAKRHTLRRQYGLGVLNRAFTSVASRSTLSTALTRRSAYYRRRLLRVSLRGSSVQARLSHPKVRARPLGSSLRTAALRHLRQVQAAQSVTNSVGYQLDSVLRKRRKKMNKHKHKKLRNRTRALRRRLGKTS
ncbi:hypothetical protein IWQ61_002683 [Dispira simplex]|nr:hypothetical protein IWQ61_002683 [Dispira simplex]